MLTEASELGIPVYVAIAPFMPFHAFTVLDQVMEAVIPLKPTEIFCEPLNPKGDAVNMVAEALAGRYPAEATLVRGYGDAAWAHWTCDLLAFGASKYRAKGFIAWPDTGRAWAKHLSAAEVGFLEQFLPQEVVGGTENEKPGPGSLTPAQKAWVTRRKKDSLDEIH